MRLRPRPGPGAAAGRGPGRDCRRPGAPAGHQRRHLRLHRRVRVVPRQRPRRRARSLHAGPPHARRGAGEDHHRPARVTRQRDDRVPEARRRGLRRWTPARRRGRRRQGDDGQRLPAPRRRSRRSADRSGTAGASTDRNTRFQPNPGGLSRRGDAEAGAEVGLRVSVRQFRLRPAERRRRPGVRRQRHRLRLRARRRHRLRPLVVPRARRRPHRADHRRRRRRASFPRLLRRHQGQRLRRRRRDRRRSVDGAASTRIRSRASRVRRSWRRAGCSCRCPRSRNRAPATRRTPAARSAAASPPTTRRPGTRLWKNFTVADEPRRTKTHLDRHAAVGARRRRRVVVTDGRSRAAGRVSGDRQRLHPAGRHRLRCGDCLRLRHRQAPVGQAGDGQRLVRARLSGHLSPQRSERQQVGDLSRRARPRHGLRQLADPPRAGPAARR